MGGEGITTAGDALPEGASVLELRLSQLRRVFNAFDPAPFHERDLDPKAEEFILDWVRELPRSATPALVVHLERGPGPPDEARLLGEAVRAYFQRRSLATQLSLRRQMRTGRMSLVIGIGFLLLTLLASRWITDNLQPSGILELLNESLVIGGWVALWRPIEILLYDWWPPRSERKLFDRLGAMPVQVRYLRGATSEEWRSDWPAIEASAVAGAGSVSVATPTP
jgi:hypothetical protein